MFIFACVVVHFLSLTVTVFFCCFVCFADMTSTPLTKLTESYYTIYTAQILLILLIVLVKGRPYILKRVMDNNKFTINIVIIGSQVFHCLVQLKACNISIVYTLFRELFT